VRLCVNAIDNSAQVLDIAKKGVYSSKTSDLVGSPIFGRLLKEESHDLFDWNSETASVKPKFRKDIIWGLGDAGDPRLIDMIGAQDIVVASNFLCHMEPTHAERCLRNIAVLAKPGGYLFVSGVDIEIRGKVMRDLGWQPVPELIEEIHDGDPSVRGDWPWAWWALEPIDKRRDDWQMRYAAVFQRPRVDGIA